MRTELSRDRFVFSPRQAADPALQWAFSDFEEGVDLAGSSRLRTTELGLSGDH
jgi:hypothetical protein